MGALIGILGPRRTQTPAIAAISPGEQSHGATRASAATKTVPGCPTRLPRRANAPQIGRATTQADGPGGGAPRAV
eukprot:5269855-Prymnesium_polylepis.2